MTDLLTCCGIPMVFTEVFGIRIYHCRYRHHPVIYVNQFTGERVTDDDLTWREQA